MSISDFVNFEGRRHTLSLSEDGEKVLSLVREYEATLARIDGELIDAAK